MKKNKLLTIMLIILIVILLFGVVALILLTQWNKSDKSSNDPSIDKVIEASVDVPEITTNLADGNYVRLQLKIQGDSKDAAEELTKRDFQINNIIIEELSEMTEEDLKGKKGKLLFESTIRNRINEIMQEGEVKEVYITSYIIQ